MALQQARLSVYAVGQLDPWEVVILTWRPFAPVHEPPASIQSWSGIPTSRNVCVVCACQLAVQVSLLWAVIPFDEYSTRQNSPRAMLANLSTMACEQYVRQGVYHQPPESQQSTVYYLCTSIAYFNACARLDNTQTSQTRSSQHKYTMMETWRQHYFNNFVHGMQDCYRKNTTSNKLKPQNGTQSGCLFGMP